MHTAHRCTGTPQCSVCSVCVFVCASRCICLVAPHLASLLAARCILSFLAASRLISIHSSLRPVSLFVLSVRPLSFRPLASSSPRSLRSVSVSLRPLSSWRPLLCLRQNFSDLSLRPLSLSSSSLLISPRPLFVLSLFVLSLSLRSLSLFVLSDLGWRLSADLS